MNLIRPSCLLQVVIAIAIVPTLFCGVARAAAIVPAVSNNNAGLPHPVIAAREVEGRGAPASHAVPPHVPVSVPAALVNVPPPLEVGSGDIVIAPKPRPDPTPNIVGVVLPSAAVLVPGPSSPGHAIVRPVPVLPPEESGGYCTVKMCI